MKYVFLALIAITVGTPACGKATAAPTFSASPFDYAIVARQDIVLQSYSVVHGDVYAADDVTLEFGYGIQRPAMNAGDFVAGDDVVIESLGDVNGDVYAGGSISLIGSAQVNGLRNPNASLIPTVKLPRATVFSEGATDVVANGPLVLSPGSYGNVVQPELFDDVYLSSGNYYLESFQVLSSSDLHLDLSGGPINVFIADDLVVERYMSVFVNGVEITASTPLSVQQLATQVLFEVHGRVRLDAGPIGGFFGTVFAPFSSVELTARDMYGSIIADGSVVAETYLTHYPSDALAVPEPAAWGAMLVAFAWMRQCRRSRKWQRCK